MDATSSTVLQGDCIRVMNGLRGESIDVAYLDPPFFTQKEHVLSGRAPGETYQFGDT